MKKPHFQKPSINKLGTVRRKARNLSQERLLKTDSIQSGKTFPLVVKPALDNLNLATWAANNPRWIETQLLQYGGILFRNFREGIDIPWQISLLSRLP